MSRETLHWINFRDSAGYVSDGTNQQPLLGTVEVLKVYPQTLTYGSPVSASLDCGWDSAVDGARDRSTTVDVRLAGVAANGASATRTLTVTLDSAGSWTVHFALGEAAVVGTAPYFKLYDDTTLLETFDYRGATTAIGEFYDPNGTLHTSAANWASNQAGKQYTFATTTLKIESISVAGTRSSIATLGLQRNPSGPSNALVGKLGYPLRGKI